MVKKELVLLENGYERPQIEIIEVEAEGNACVIDSMAPDTPGIG